ncbi:hypothetical protein J5N97_029329 [Dioscorea zingiberensis]|uniref:Erythronate-4-phosphate dehydrogenase family protein n=1 Tax=Dioscorea zingiberensis TaxID=325984 RepID=A0A9D5C046_9LILI|nr:hypothetical protein J5N97_029329 [Dioscorea zingiberensis]
MMDPPCTAAEPEHREKVKDSSMTICLPPPKRSGPPPPSSWLEIRLFYVRISPCPVDSVPPRLTLSHLRREMGVSLEINGGRVPSSDPTALTLRCDRLDRDAAEVTYVSTDLVRLTGAVEFEVTDDKGFLILCGSLERMEVPWGNGSIGLDRGHTQASSDKDIKTGWGMDCYSAASIASSAFVQPKLGISSPSIEVYIAGCCSGHPLILSQTIQLSPRCRTKPGMLDAIPEDEETMERELRNSDGLLRHRRSSSSVAEGEVDEYDQEKAGHNYYPEGWYTDDDGQLSWFNAGVRVGVGIGLGMCVGIGIGVGLLMRSYQATTRTFKRRFF